MPNSLKGRASSVRPAQSYMTLITWRTVQVHDIMQCPLSMQAVTDALVSAADACQGPETADPISSDDLLPLLIATLVKVPHIALYVLGHM